MAADRENNVSHIKQQIEQGTYRVEPRAVADAILRRLRGVPPASEGASPEPSAGGVADGSQQRSN